MKEHSVDIDYMNYFKRLEQERKYECLQCEQARKIKQQQLWFQIDQGENIQNEKSLEKKSINNSQKDINQNYSIEIPDLPFLDEIQVTDSHIINHNSIQTVKIINGNFDVLPNGLYERMLICLDPLFYERLDYENLTLGRTVDKDLIKIARLDNEKQIHLTTNHTLLERIQNILINNLFSFYPMKKLHIKT